MRYEDLKYSDDILPLILRYDSLSQSRHTMYMHWHEAVEILLIRQGRLRIFNGEMRAEAREGEMVCIHSGHMHLFESITEQCQYHCIIFPRQALDSIELYRASLPQITDDGEAVEWMERLLTVMEEKADFYREKGKGLLAQLYVRLVEIGGAETFGNESRPTRLVKSAMEYIDSHYYQPQISVDRVAKAVGVSRSHLCHVFKDMTGQSVSSYWQGLRCDLGRRYLMDGYSVAEAASWAGFASQSYFSRAYQKHFGVLPSKDRRK